MFQTASQYALRATSRRTLQHDTLCSPSPDGLFSSTIRSVLQVQSAPPARYALLATSRRPLHHDTLCAPLPHDTLCSAKSRRPILQHDTLCSPSPDGPSITIRSVHLSRTTRSAPPSPDGPCSSIIRPVRHVQTASSPVRYALLATSIR